MRILVAFRTHIWNDSIALTARWLRGAVASHDFVVLADESRGSIGVEGFEVVSHTDKDMAHSLKLHPPTRVLWYNADYALYSLQAKKPDYDFYLMVENDVFINSDLSSVIEEAVSNGVDFIATRIREAPSSWPWKNTVDQRFPVQRQAWIQILGLSSRALNALYSARVRDTSENVDPWPYCEAFIPSLIGEHSGFRELDLGSIYNLDFFSALFAFGKGDIRLYSPGILAHPVLDDSDAVMKRALSDDPWDALVEESELSLILKRTQEVTAAEKVWWRAFRSQKLRSKLPDLATKLSKYVKNEKPFRSNLALHGTAFQSSDYRTGETDGKDTHAWRALDGHFADSSGFHTKPEESAYWTLDLGGFFPISEILLFHRKANADRSVGIGLYGSLNGNDWLDLLPGGTKSAFGGLIHGKPFRKQLPGSPFLRFIKVTAPPSKPLHLDQVVVYGIK